jgi:taurine dioxygenase
MAMSTGALQSGLELTELTMPAGLEVSLADGTCGVYVRGVDLAVEPGGEVVYCLRTLADNAGFTVIRNQAHLTPERLAEVVQWFGAGFVAPQGVGGIPKRRPGIVNVMPPSGGPTGHLAVYPHSDNQPLQVVPDFTFLLAVDIPPPEAGPITWFADLFRAWEDLDPSLKARVESARQRPYSQAVANYRCFEQIRLDMDRGGFTPRGDEVCDVLHPVVRTHPVSGRRALWVSRMTAEIVGMGDEGKTLAAQLAAHVEQEHHFSGHRWAPGDLLIFDNRATVHKRDPWDPAYPRVLWGAQAGGARPF